MRAKKSMSEIISFVLLLTIVVATSAAVYSWIQYYAPITKEKCPAEIALAVADYRCIGQFDLLNLTIENKGNFKVDGFYIRGAKEKNTPIIVNLPCSSQSDNCGFQSSNPFEDGRYYFMKDNQASLLYPDEKINVVFSYTGLGNLSKLQIQPFIVGEETKTLKLCENIIEIDIDPSKNCN